MSTDVVVLCAFSVYSESVDITAESFGLAKRQQHCEDFWCHVKDSKETPRQEWYQSWATEGIHREIVTLCLWVTLISVLPDTIQAFTNNYKDRILSSLEKEIIAEGCEEIKV